MVISVNNRFVLPQTWTVNMQSILEFLHFIHDFLDNGNTGQSSVYIFHVISVTRLKNKIENNSTWEGPFYQSEGAKFISN